MDQKYFGLNSEEIQGLKEIKERKLKAVNWNLKSLKRLHDDVIETKETKIAKIVKQRNASYEKHERKIQAIDLKINNAKKMLAEAKEKKCEATRKKEQDLQKLHDEDKRVRKDADNFLEDLKKQEAQAKTERSVLSQEISQLTDESKRKRSNATRISVIRSVIGETSSKMVNKEFLKHLRSEISNMEQELECPVCLEVSEVPIYTCPAQHHICGNCWNDVMGSRNRRRWRHPCPTCRADIQNPPPRHRLMEKMAEQLKQSRSKLDKMMNLK